MSERRPPYGFNSTLRVGSKPLRKVNREKRARRDSEGRVYGPHHAWVKNTHRCILHDSPGHVCSMPMDGHHVYHVGSGGEDMGNVIPLCRGAHTMEETSVHVMGCRSFEEYWGVDMELVAWELWDTSPHNPENA